MAITVGPQNVVNALALQSDGKPVVAGSSLGSGILGAIFLARFLPDGQPDPTFGHGGKVTTTIGTSQGAFALIQQPDGKLVATGYVGGATDVPNAVLLVRYLPDGSLDPTFGTGGVVNVSPVGTSNSASALFLQADGKLVVTGSGFIPVTPGTFFIMRFLPNGSLDPTFGQAGMVVGVPPLQGAMSSGQAVIQEPDGELVVAGIFPTNRGPGVLARYLPDGRLDPTFGAGSIAMLSSGSSGGLVTLIQQPDRKFVVGGGVADADTRGILLARFRPDGLLDAGFGVGGLVTTAFEGQASARAVRQQADGKLVVGGRYTTAGANDVLMARYQALGCPTADPDPCLASLTAFVTEVYQAALARQPDAAEEAFWIDVLTSDPSPDAVRGLLHVVFESPEFRQRPLTPWQYVEALYRAMLGREPDQAELDWWVQVVLDRMNTLLPEFLTSPEFQRLVPSCEDQAAVTLLVGRVYQQVLRRVASPEELAWWTADIVTWCAVDEAVEVIVTSPEYLSVPRTLADHVMVLYRALLAREPDAGGLAGWVDDLARRLRALEDDVMASPEFEARASALFP